MIGIQVSDMTVGTTIANLGMTDVKFPQPAVRGRHGPLHHRGAGQARVEVAARARDRRIPSQARINQNDKLVAECKRQAFMLMRPKPMRSLLFVPADSEKKLAKGLRERRRRADPRPGGSVAAARKAAARETALAFLEQHAAQREPPAPARARQRARHRPDATPTSTASWRCAPMRSCCRRPKAAPSVVHLDAKLAAREAIHGLPDGGIKILALATETAAALFRRRHLCAARARGSPALTWGAEDLSADLGSETNRDEAGRFTSPYMLARTLSLAAAAAARVQPIDTVYADFRNMEGSAPRNARSAARRLHRQDGDPSGAGRDHQRGVHAVRPRRSRRRARSWRLSPRTRRRVSSRSTA